jgi:hypothetical protein
MAEAAARAVAEAAPTSRFLQIEGVDHAAPPSAYAPHLREFFKDMWDADLVAALASQDYGKALALIWPVVLRQSGVAELQATQVYETSVGLSDMTARLFLKPVDGGGMVLVLHDIHVLWPRASGTSRDDAPLVDLFAERSSRPVFDWERLGHCSIQIPMPPKRRTGFLVPGKADLLKEIGEGQPRRPIRCTVRRVAKRPPTEPEQTIPGSHPLPTQNPDGSEWWPCFVDAVEASKTDAQTALELTCLGEIVNAVHRSRLPVMHSWTSKSCCVGWLLCWWWDSSF